MNTIIETITVEKAQEYLNTSRGNRPISKSTIQSYADTMKQGKWMLNGVSIIFDIDGCLIDGHHRLHAICLSGIPVKMSVCRGIESEAFTTYDCGLHRTLGQLLALQGVKHYNVVGSIVAANHVLNKTGKIYSNNGKSTGRNHTNTERYDIYCKDAAGYNDAAVFASDTYTKAGVLNKSWIGGLYYYLTRTGRYGEAQVRTFFEELCSFNESNNSAIESLRKRILHERMRDRKISVPILFALLVKTWNAYITGKDVKVLKYDDNVEEYPTLILR